LKRKKKTIKMEGKYYLKDRREDRVQQWVDQHDVRKSELISGDSMLKPSALRSLT